MTLDEYLTAEGETAMAFAERIKVAPSTITRLRNGEAWPDPKTIATILDATNQRVTLDGLYQAWHAAHPAAGQPAA